MKERKYLDVFPELTRGAVIQERSFRARAALFMAVVGPGIITAFADNDAGGIATYIAAGAHYGYALLFTLLISTVCLAMAQEISARTGAVTGKGLFELIRAHYGRGWNQGVLWILLVANIGTTASEFSGIAIAFDIFGISKYIAVPLVGMLIWLLVVKANYGCVEKIFFLLCATFVSYIAAGVMADPPWSDILSSVLVPQFSGGSGFLLMAMGIVGTTITPWGQFYIQASIVDKGITAREYPYTAVDVIIGSFFTGLIAFFVIVVMAVHFYGGESSIETMQEGAAALAPVAGQYAQGLFAFGLLGASLLAAVILPLSTAYAICEALGYTHGISKTCRDAPQFFAIYTALVAIGAGIVLVPHLSLYALMLATQVLNGVLLPPILIVMLRIAGDPEIMGNYRNPPLYHALAWAFTALIILLTVVLALTSLFPEAFSVFGSA